MDVNRNEPFLFGNAVYFDGVFPQADKSWLQPSFYLLKNNLFPDLAVNGLQNIQTHKLIHYMHFQPVNRLSLDLSIRDFIQNYIHMQNLNFLSQLIFLFIFRRRFVSQCLLQKLDFSFFLNLDFVQFFLFRPQSYHPHVLISSKLTRQLTHNMLFQIR